MAKTDHAGVRGTALAAIPCGTKKRKAE